MPKKTKRAKLKADKKRQSDYNPSHSPYSPITSTSYTFTDTSSNNVKKKESLQEVVPSIKYLKSDLFKTLFLTTVGIGFEFFLFFFWKQ